MSTPFNRTRSLWLNARLATMDTQHPAPYGALHDHMLVVEQGRIAAILPQGQLNPASFDGEVVDAAGRWITPGLSTATPIWYTAATGRRNGNSACWACRISKLPPRAVALSPPCVPPVR
jgi:hypothetical protein